MKDEWNFVDDNGMYIVYWPPRGEAAGIWEKFSTAFPDPEHKAMIMSLLMVWLAEHSTLVAIVDEEGNVEDLEPNWDTLNEWLDP